MAVELEDNRAVMLSGGATYRVLPDNDPSLRDVIDGDRPLGELVKESLRRDGGTLPHGTVMAFDIDVGTTWGSDTQTVTRGKFIQTENGSFDGPFEMRADFWMTRAWSTFRAGYWSRSQWVFEGMIGVALVHRVVEARGGGQSILDDARTSPEVFIGPRISFYPVRAVGFYTENTLGFLKNGSWLGAAELGVMFGPVPGVVLELGYRHWLYIEEHDHGSDIEIAVGGLLPGLRLEI